MNKTNHKIIHGDAIRGRPVSYIYKKWINMRHRCNNKNAHNYNRYGGKGIYVCDEWQNSYLLFKKWFLANGGHRGLIVDKDKICIEKNISPHYYSPETCTLLTLQENNKYRKNVGRPKTAIKRKQNGLFK